MHEQESKKQRRLLQFASQNMYLKKAQILSHVQLKIHAYKISLKHELRDLFFYEMFDYEDICTKKIVKIF